MVDVIEKKRDGGALTKEEIEFFVKGYSNGSIPDYQASALCMAIIFRGMNEEETSFLTDAMMHSGDTIDLSCINGVVVDKHSTGGVGDKTSLAVGPLAAACGAKVGKMSGRGLGHTGGTLDKLEAIPGMQIFLSEKQFVEQIEKVGLSIIGQTKEIDPADKKLYALRDVTGTVPSIPLIASSIMSKKLAAGSQAILLDVKFGDGAFMKTLDSARTLANEMVKIGKLMGRDTRAVLTDMDQPLGMAVGNSLEVKEAIDTLNGKGPEDFHEICVSSGAILLQQAHLVETLEEGREKIQKAIDDRSGLRKLAEFVAAQGGDPEYIMHPELFPVAKYVIPIKSDKDGYVRHIDSLSIGLSSMKLGGGREKITDSIDYDAGIVLCKKVGYQVKKDEILCYAHTNKENVDSVIEEIRASFHIQEEEVAMPSIVHGYIH